MQGTFEELGGSPRIAVDENGLFTAERFFYLSDWNDWPEFMELLRGKTSRVGLVSVVEISTAHFPGIASLKVSAVAVEPYDGENPDQTALTNISTGLNSYSGGARVRAQYRVPEPDEADKPPTEDGTFLTWEQELGMDVLSVPGRHWKWFGGPPQDVQDEIPVGIKVPVAVHTVTWSNVAYPPRATIRELRGRLNDAAFLGAPAGCILFTGAKISTTLQTDGSTKYALVYTFHEKTAAKITDPLQLAGHNHFYYGPGHGGEHWFEVVAVQSGQPVYQLGNMNRLFEYGA